MHPPEKKQTGVGIGDGLSFTELKRSRTKPGEPIRAGRGISSGTRPWGEGHTSTHVDAQHPCDHRCPGERRVMRAEIRRQQEGCIGPRAGQMQPLREVGQEENGPVARFILMLSQNKGQQWSYTWRERGKGRGEGEERETEEKREREREREREKERGRGREMEGERDGGRERGKKGGRERDSRERKREGERERWRKKERDEGERGRERWRKGERQNTGHMLDTEI